MAKTTKAATEAESAPAPEATPIEPAPILETPAPVLSALERFKAEFWKGGSLQPLEWGVLSGTKFRIASSRGILCNKDGSEVVLSAGEASELAGLLRAIRPTDNIHIHIS